MKQLIKGGLLATCAGFFAAPMAAQAEEESAAIAPGNFRLSAGVNFSSGDYGEIEDTEVFSIPVALTYKKDGLKIRVSIPWVTIDGPGSLVVTPEGRGGGGDSSGSGSFNSGSGSSGSEVEVEDEDEGEVIDDDGNSGGSDDGGDDGGDDDTGGEDDAAAAALVAPTALAVPPPSNKRSGFGDVQVTAVYTVELGSDFYFEPGLKLKVPTASRSKRLGTGKVDVTVTADLLKDVGPATFYVHARRKFAGKPEGSAIRSTWGAAAGASVRVAKGVSIGADYDWQQSVFAGRQPTSEATAWAFAKLGQRMGLTVYASTGFNANSADIAGGATISIRF